MTQSGRSLELFFIDGRPDGMLTAQVFNWTGHVLRSPRTQMKDALSRPEAAHTGVYILVGEMNDTPTAYIGEAEELRTRLQDHVKKKEWWDTAVLVTTTANNLHKAHIKYLEARLYEIALSDGSVQLDNSNTPTRSSLSEADRANMESFLDTLKMVLPAIRVDMFMDKIKPAATAILDGGIDDLLKPVFNLVSRKHRVDARAQIIDGEWVILKGSIGRHGHANNNSATISRISKLHQQLLNSGVVISENGQLTFQDNYAFRTPSGASDILLGYSSNGRREWKSEQTGQTYADWESEYITSGASLI